MREAERRREQRSGGKESYKPGQEVIQVMIVNGP